MEDNDIIKALKTLLELVLVEGCLQRAKTISKALDLINRLKEKNSNLTSDLISLQKDLTSLQKDLTSLRAENERLRPFGVQVEVSKKIEKEIKADGGKK